MEMILILIEYNQYDSLSYVNPLSLDTVGLHFQDGEFLKFCYCDFYYDSDVLVVKILSIHTDFFSFYFNCKQYK